MDDQPKERRTDAAVEMPAARALMTLDDLNTFLLAASLEATEQELEALDDERTRLQDSATPDADRIENLNARIAATQSYVPAMVSRFERSLASQGPVPAGTAIVAGRVFEPASNVGLANVTVIATAATGGAIARTATDAQGRFEIVIPEKAAAAVSLEVKSGRATLHLDQRPSKVGVGERIYRDVAVHRAGGQAATQRGPTRKAAKPPRKSDE